MYGSWENCLGLSLGSMLTFLGMTKVFTAGEVEQTPTISVWVYNLANVSPDYVAEAEAEASSILEKAGVKLIWRSIPFSDNGVRQPSLEHLGATGFAMRIVPRSMAERMDPRHTTLGLAVPCQPGEAGCIANVFYDRADQLAAECRTEGRCLSSAQILGHASAHEIGHLLLGSNSHSSAGLMRANWWSKDLRLPAREGLFFTLDQAEQIRREVLRRMERDRPTLGSALKKKFALSNEQTGVSGPEGQKTPPEVSWCPVLRTFDHTWPRDLGNWVAALRPSD
jgi:hypothetical protein